MEALSRPVRRFKAGLSLEGNFTAENVEGCSRGVFQGLWRILDTITQGEYNRSGEEAARICNEAEKKPRETNFEGTSRICIEA